MSWDWALGGLVGQRQPRGEKPGCGHLHPPWAASWELSLAVTLEKIRLVALQTMFFMLTSSTERGGGGVWWTGKELCWWSRFKPHH